MFISSISVLSLYFNLFLRWNLMFFKQRRLLRSALFFHWFIKQNVKEMSTVSNNSPAHLKYKTYFSYNLITWESSGTVLWRRNWDVSCSIVCFTVIHSLDRRTDTCCVTSSLNLSERPWNNTWWSGRFTP